MRACRFVASLEHCLQLWSPQGEWAAALPALRLAPVCIPVCFQLLGRCLRAARWPKGTVRGRLLGIARSPAPPPAGSGRAAILAAYQQGARRLDAHLHHRLPFRSDGYILSLLLPAQPPAAPAALGPAAAVEGAGARVPPPPQLLEAQLGQPSGSLWDQPHKLQEWFGGGPCLLLAPDSYSGRILASEVGFKGERSQVLAPGAQLAPCPAFLPVWLESASVQLMMAA